jgi:beta-lactamase regulating signal transducer with metallopeptidase domain/protocatechuate 3,4-dioxygenase beta subunit
MSEAWAVTLLAKSTLVLAMASLVTLGMRRSSSSARHAVWTLTLAAIACMPLLIRVLPRWEVRVLPAAPLPASIVVEPTIDRDAAPAPALVDDPGAGLPGGADPPPAALPIPVSAASPAVGCRTWGLVAWLAGALFGISRLIGGVALIGTTVSRAAIVTDDEWRRLLADAAATLGLRRPVGLRRSAAVVVPVVWGLRRPIVLLPRDADDWPHERRRAFLLHELAHVARHDCATQTLASLAAAFYWPQPLVWWAVCRLRAEAERACDDRVLAAGTEAPDYAHHLLDAARSLRDAPRAFAHASAVVERTSLGDRLLAVLDDRTNRAALTMRVAAAAAGLAVAFTAAVSMLQPVARAAVVEALRAAVAAPAVTNASDTAAPAVVTPPARAIATARPAPALVGVVKSADGKPVAKALILAWEAGRNTSGEVFVGRTDDGGEFRLSVPGTASYRVRIEAAPWAPHTIEKVGVQGRIAVTLLKGAAIEGIVRDGVTRRPVALALVRGRAAGVGVPSVPAEPDAGMAVATADKDGRYRLEGLVRGTHLVTATAPGYASGEREAADGATGVDLFLSVGASVSGTVSGDDGKPVSGATVDAECDIPCSTRVAGARTDGQGRYALLGLESNDYHVLVRHPAFAPAVASAAPKLGILTPLDVRLEKGVRVVGRLVGADERAVRGRVVLQALDGVEAPSRLNEQMRAVAGADGRFALAGLPRGVHTLAVFPVGYAAARAEVSISGREPVVDIGDVRLETGLIVRGRVHDASGGPVKGAVVRASGTGPSERRGASGSGESEEDGRFVVAGLEKGAYRVTATAKGYAPSATVDADAGGTSIDIVLAPEGKITGTVVSETGEPLRDCRLSARSTSGTEGGVAHATPSPNGRFEVGRIGSGTYVLEVQASDHLDKAVPDVKMESGRTVDVGRVTLSRGGTVRGVVVDGSGEPIAGAEVRGSDQTRGFNNFMRRATTDGTGRFEMRGLAPGTVQVTASHRRYAPSQNIDVVVDPAAPPADTRITLLEGGRVQGTARDRQGRSVEGAFAQINTRNVPFGGFRGNGPIHADGTFVVEHVAPGPAQAILMGGTGGRFTNLLSKDVEVRDGETTAVNLDLLETLVTGRLTRAGKPLANQRITLSGNFQAMMATGDRQVAPVTRSGPERMTGVTNAEGRYELIVTNPGKYRVEIASVRDTAAYSKGTGSAAPQDVVVPDAETFVYDVALPDYGFAGVVATKDGGEPIAEARVDVRPSDGSPGGAMMTTAADGRFQIAVAPGAYRVRVTAAKYVPQEAAITVGSAPLEQRYDLIAGATLRGTVRTGGGRGVDFARVVAVASDGTAARDTRTAADGSFALEGLPAGSYNVLAVHTAGFALDVGASLDARTDVVLHPSVKVHLTFDDAKGAPLPNTPVRIDMYKVDGAIVGTAGLHQTASGKTDGTGVVDLPLPLGTLDVRVSASDDGLRGEARIVAAPDAGPATITLKPR